MSDNIGALQELPAPNDPTANQGCCGLASFVTCNSFTYDYAHGAGPDF